MTNPNDLASDMTKREHFAMAAMQGNLSNSTVQNFDQDFHLGISEDSVKLADALIAELNKPTYRIGFDSEDGFKLGDRVTDGVVTGVVISNGGPFRTLKNSKKKYEILIECRQEEVPIYLRTDGENFRKVEELPADGEAEELISDGKATVPLSKVLEILDGLEEEYRAVRGGIPAYAEGIRPHLNTLEAVRVALEGLA